ncbi:YjfB family protein [Neopusillimonas maritima]|uniref:Motility protein n=1 Tax=Neopusillimonas maritima TaxID=2026239 RepID=A0A3A1YS98_9BURK|nr:YjfB family protein [Neopusillimonas maritima]RIY38897.1 hypothetical protein CJP73_16020 [Neopusillimonas maritima]
MELSSVESAVSAYMGLKNASAQQDQQIALLRKTLDNQKKMVEQIMSPLEPKLANSGSVGTRLHVTA